ncbi:MAG: TRAP transporter small permease [Lachnospiraceae bacterium]|nr:TRAP transporter small permease [Lachnospiraceae bacterium]
MKYVIKALDKIEEVVLFLLLAFMTVMNFVNVVARYCFTVSISFTEELTIMAFVWISMFGIAVGYKKYAHLGMSFFTDLMPKKVRSYFVLFSMVCSAITIAVMLKYGIAMVAQQIAYGAKTAALRLPSCVQGLSIPVGACFILIRTFQSGISQFIRLQKEAKIEKEKEAC